MWRERYNWFQSRLAELQAKSVVNGGTLKNSEHWQVEYYRHPYFVRANEESYFQRFCDVSLNQFYLSAEGEIAHIDVLQDDSSLMKKFTCLLEEQSLREGITSRLSQAISDPINEYFLDGGPVGVKLFKDVVPPKTPYLVKFSTKEFIKQMLHHGRFRISPASLYSKGNLLFAQQDLETERDFIVPCYDRALLGYKSVKIQGKTYNIEEEEPVITTSVQDYYLLSLCTDLDRRMPTDFDSDTALIIKDRRKFQRLVFGELQKKLIDWNFSSGDVDYYDPYLDYKKYKELERTKHFRFQYQKEYRFLARSSKPISIDLEPFLFNIGPMNDYAEICSL